MAAESKDEIECLDMHTHVWIRKEMYLGSVALQNISGITFSVGVDEEKHGDSKKRKVTVHNVKQEPYSIEMSKAVLKLLDELVTNSLDNGFRDDKQSKIRIGIDPVNKCVEVYNDGVGIAPSMFKDTDNHNITVIFGEYLSGTNFSQDEDGDTGNKFSGGLHGLGAVLVNRFSKKFRVEVACPESGTLFLQEWKDNMNTKLPPVIKKYKESTGFVRVVAHLDFAALGMDIPGNLPEDLVKAMSRRAWDAAACSCLRKNKISLAMQVPVPPRTPCLPVEGGVQFLKILCGEGPKEGRVIAHETVTNERGIKVFDVSLCMLSEAETDSLNSTDSRINGYINGICCNDGSHIRLVTSSLVKYISTAVKKKTKREDIVVKPSIVTSRVAMVVVALVAAKKFTSQAKDKLDTDIKNLGFKWTPSSSFLNSVGKTGLVEFVIENAKNKEDASAKKSVTVSRAGLSRIDKFDAPAKNGTKGKKPHLLITEGDSAKALVVAGLKTRDFTGIYSLTGKIINPRGKPITKVMENKVVQDLCKILSIKPGEKYTKESAEALPFSHLVIVADQDADGSHIAGLVINWLMDSVPTLLEAKPDFVKRFFTALIKATPTGRLASREEEIQFYTMQQYQKWEKENISMLNSWKIKYYKGLGTSTSAEARKYFQNYERHLLSLQYKGDGCKNAIETFFDGKKVAMRKDLLMEYDSSTYIDFEGGSASLEEVVKTDLCNYAWVSTRRAICGFDGLKSSQRKVLFYFLGVKGEIKVAQAGAAVAHRTHYPNGEGSLVEAIVNMSTDFVCTNNVPILIGQGQFGSRNNHRHASARYIFTETNNLITKVFRKEDTPVLENLFEEGQEIEPECYCGVVPLLLINGACGIGTGWSTYVPPYHPLEVADKCIEISKRVIERSPGEGELYLADACTPLSELQPYFDGFTGITSPVDESGNFYSTGVWSIDVDECKLTITELPVTTVVETYETYIKEKLMIPLQGKRKVGDESPGEDTAALVRDIYNGGTEFKVYLEIYCDPVQFPRLVESESDLISTFKLRQSFSTNNMYFFDTSQKLCCFTKPSEIIEEHAYYRINMYNKRFKHQIAEKENELEKISDIVRFVELIVEGELELRGKPSKVLGEELLSLGFKEGERGYRHLTDMPISNITLEKAENLKKDMEGKKLELEVLRNSKATDVWEKELVEFKEAYLQYKDDKRQRQGSTTITENKKKKSTKKKK